MTSSLLTTLLTLVAAESALEPQPFSVLLLPILVIIVLVALNGLFVAAEFAILGARRTRMEQLEQEGDKHAAQVMRTLDDNELQNRYIATAQLGITIVTLGLAMYGEPQIAHYLEPYLARLLGRETVDATVVSIGYFIAIGLLTYLHVVVGEMVPKSLALADANNVVLRINPAMRWLERLFIVPIRVLNGIGNGLLRVLRVPVAPAKARLYSAEEIEQIVSESTEGGFLTEEAEEMIRNIFDFSDRTVGQVMTPRRKMQAIPVDTPHEALLQLVVESNHSRFPVYEGDDDHVIGILHLKDLVRYHLYNGTAFDLREMLRPAPIVPEDQQVEVLLAAFKRQRLHMAIVLDEFGGVAGIVTLEDLVEEVVGEVRDEFDIENEPYVELQPGVIELAGDYLLDDLQDDVFLGDEESLPDVETVGGLIVTLIGRPPQVGDEVTLQETVTLRVLAVDGRAVGRVKVTYPVVREESGAENGAESGRGHSAESPPHNGDDH